MTRPRSAAAAVVALLALVLAACGVGPENRPRPLPPEAASAIAIPTPATSPDRAGLLVELWFVDDTTLAPVNRTTPRPLTPEDKIRALEAGPTATELAQGLRTAVTSVDPEVPLVQTAESAGIAVNVGDQEVAVVLNPEFDSLPASEQSLILGQVVMTLTSQAGSSVVFVNETGTPVGVPLPNGRLTSGPVTSADYSALIG